MDLEAIVKVEASDFSDDFENWLEVIKGGNPLAVTENDEVGFYILNSDDYENMMNQLGCRTNEDLGKLGVLSDNKTSTPIDDPGGNVES